MGRLKNMDLDFFRTSDIIKWSNNCPMTIEVEDSISKVKLTDTISSVGNDGRLLVNREIYFKTKNLNFAFKTRNLEEVEFRKDRDVINAVFRGNSNDSKKFITIRKEARAMKWEEKQNESNTRI